MLDDAMEAARIRNRELDKRQGADAAWANASAESARELLRDFAQRAPQIERPLPVGGWKRRGSGRSYRWMGLGVMGWQVDYGIAVLTDARAIYAYGFSDGGSSTFRGVRGPVIAVNDVLSRIDGAQPWDTLREPDWSTSAEIGSFGVHSDKGLPRVRRDGAHGSGLLRDVLATWLVTREDHRPL